MQYCTNRMFAQSLMSTGLSDTRALPSIGTYFPSTMCPTIGPSTGTLRPSTFLQPILDLTAYLSLSFPYATTTVFAGLSNPCVSGIIFRNSIA
ncbi:hypothetical protein [Methanomethylophilus alvi]|uniref:hypothetical protein n=1 Tax=Methanomethylophilus alvi TaxID=1291540 RepID=UPI0037DCF9A4